MAGIKGQPSAKPQSLAQPVPSADAAATADSFLSDFSAPQMRGPASDGGGDTADAFLSDFSSGGEGADQMPPPTDGNIPQEQFAPEPGFVQANVEQFKPQNFIDRLQTGLAANDEEKTAFLKKKYGDGNVTMKDGNIYYRRADSEKFRRLDPGTLEIVSDIIPDFAREIVTEGAMIPGEVAGATAGAAAGLGLGAPVTAPGGLVAGRVASVPFANAAADKVAEWAGVPQDESRNRTAENVVGMGLEAALPVVGGKIARTVTKKIPGTAAYKAAREAGEREVVALTKQSKEVIAAAKALEDEGIKVGLMANQVHDTSQPLEKLARKVEDLPAFQAKEQEFAQGYGDSLVRVVEDMKKSANPTGARASSEAITDAAKASERLEGERIGMFKAKALANTRNAKVPLPEETNKLAKAAMTELGFVPKTQRLNSVTRPGSISGMADRGVMARNVVERTKWVPPDPQKMQALAGRLGLDDGQLRVMVNGLNQYGEFMTRGSQARLSDVEMMINRMGPMTQKLRGTEGGRVLSRLVGELRQHRRGMIEAGLPNDLDKKLFNDAMDEFGLKRSVMEDLAGVLDRDVSTKALVNNFFKGGAAPERINALKTVLGTDSPQWGALKEEFLNQMVLKHTSAKSRTGFNSSAMLADIKKNYGENFVREVLDQGKGPNFDTLKNLLTVGERIEMSQRGLKVDDASEKVKQGLLEGTFGIVSNASFRLLNGVRKVIGASGEKESALMEILNRDGYQKYLTKYKAPEGVKKKIADRLEVMMADYNAARSASKQTAQVLDIGKDVLKRGARAEIKGEAQTGR